MPRSLPLSDYLIVSHLEIVGLHPEPGRKISVRGLGRRVFPSKSWVDHSENPVGKGHLRAESTAAVAKARQSPNPSGVAALRAKLPLQQGEHW